MRARSSLCLFALAAAVASASAEAVRAQGARTIKAGDLVIQEPWSRATPGGAKIGAGYLVVENRGATADRLVGGSFDRAARVEIHEMSMTDGVMRMRPVEAGLAIPPGGRLE